MREALTSARHARRPGKLTKSIPDHVAVCRCSPVSSVCTIQHLRQFQAFQGFSTVETMAEVCALSGRVFPRRRGPVHPITGWPSLSPPFLYPLRHLLPCGRNTAAFRRAGRVGLTLLSDLEKRMGRLRPIVRRGLMSPSSVLAADDPPRVPFWRRPVSTFGRLPMTDLDNGRSLAFSLPSSAGPPPD